MSDATDFTSAMAELKRMVQPDLDPVLSYGDGVSIDLEQELDSILENNRRASTWATNVDYEIGDVVQPTVRNGHRYIVISAGTSTTEPSWGLTDYSTASDGDLTFQEDGGVYRNIYDVRAAAYEAWMLKASKASEYLKSTDADESVIYQRCVDQANRYVSVGVV